MADSNDPIIINGEALRESLLPQEEVKNMSFQEAADLEEKIEKETPETGFWETAGVAIEDNWIGPSVARGFDRDQRQEQTGEDADFQVREEEMEVLLNEYTPKDMDYLIKADSRAEFEARRMDIKEDKARKEFMSRSGLKGDVLNFTMAALDPALAIATLATGGLAVPATMSRSAKALRYAGIAGAENAAVEAYLLSNDTAKDASDVVISGLGGAVLGGGIGALRRVALPEADINPIAREMDNLDNLNTRTADAMEQVRVNDAIIKVQERSNMPTADIDRAVSAHGLNLEANANYTPMSRIANKLDKKARLDAVTELSSLKAQRIKANAAYWSKVGVVKKGHRGFHETGAWHETKGLDNQIATLEAKVADIDSRATIDVQGKEYAKELKAWRKMTPEQRKAKVFPSGTPEVRKVIETKVTRIRSLDEGSTANSRTFFTDAVNKANPPKDEGGSVGAAQAFKPEDTSIFVNPNAEGIVGDWLSDAINKQADIVEVHGKNWSGIVPKVFLSDYTNLSQSNFDEVKALGAKLFENPQGKSLGDNASVLTLIHTNLIRYAQGGRLQRGFEAYLKENGTNTVKGHILASYRADFENQVAIALRNRTPDADLPESVKLARDGVAAQFAKALELRKMYGEHGFEKVSTDKGYVPDIMHREAVDTLIFRDGVGRKEMHKFIRDGYLKGDNNMSKAQADVVADIKMRSMLNGKVLADDAMSVYRANSLNEAVALLEKAGMSREKIDAFVADIGTKQDWAMVSNRARKTLKIDWNHSAVMGPKGKEYKISDIMNTNLSQLTEAYTKESAFGSAMAKMGIKSEAQLARTMQVAKESAFESIHDQARAGRLENDPLKLEHQAAEDFARVEDGITQLRGQSLVDYRGSNGKPATSATWGRRLLDFTGLLRLQQMGFASIPELSNGLTTAGIGHILRAVPGAGALRMPFSKGRSRGADFKQLNEDMLELEGMVGFIGEDDWVNTFSVRGDDFGSDGTGNFTKALDNAMEGGRRVGSFISGFKYIQQGFEKITARAINQKLLKSALGKEVLSKDLMSQLKSTGMLEPKQGKKIGVDARGVDIYDTTTRWAEISDWVKANKSSKTQDGSSFDTWNIEKMPADMRSDLQVSMTRLMNRSMQKSMIGETNSKWLGANARFITQFKNYTLVALEKQLVAGMRGDTSAMATKMLWSTGLSYFAYAAQINLRALGMEDRAAEQYREERLEGAMLGWGVLAKHSQLASVGLVADHIASFAASADLVDPQYLDSGRHVYQRGVLDTFAPAVGVIEGMGSAGISAAKAAGSGFSDEGANNKALRDAMGTLPFMRGIYYGEALKTIADIND
jgi:hypothetical protein